MMSLVWILACPLGMFAMGGVVWLASRLPGRRAERLARVASRGSCMSMGAKQQPAEGTDGAPDSSAEHELVSNA
jgi:hypothetical protein